MNPGRPPLGRRPPVPLRHRGAGRVTEEDATESAQTRAPAPGIVGREGGGTAPHPMGGGAAWSTPHKPAHAGDDKATS